MFINFSNTCVIHENNSIGFRNNLNQFQWDFKFYFQELKSETFGNSIHFNTFQRKSIKVILTKNRKYSIETKLLSPCKNNRILSQNRGICDISVKVLKNATILNPRYKKYFP